MGEIIKFRSKADIAEETGDVDLLTAVDAAIRDLRDISERWGEEAARDACASARQQGLKCDPRRASAVRTGTAGQAAPSSGQ